MRGIASIAWTPEGGPVIVADRNPPARHHDFAGRR
jgi:hypothetical protein